MRTDLDRAASKIERLEADLEEARKEYAALLDNAKAHQAAPATGARIRVDVLADTAERMGRLAADAMLRAGIQ